MNELLSKLSSYHLFNYLLPGVLFVVLAKAFLNVSFVQTDLVLAAFLYYFIGLVISRIGSVVVEPALKKIKFVEFASYRSFVAASKTDPKIEVLSEANNTYRTLITMFLLLILVKAWQGIATWLPWLHQWDIAILVVLLLTLFLSAYRKQTRYIVKRIEATGE